MVATFQARLIDRNVVDTLNDIRRAVNRVEDAVEGQNADLRIASRLVDNLRREFRRLGRLSSTVLDRATTSLRNLTLATTAAVGAFGFLTINVANNARQLGALATAAGATVEEIDALAQFTTRYNVSTDAAVRGITAFTRRLQEANATGNTRIFDDLGLSVETLLALPLDERLQQVFIRVQSLSDATQRAGILQTLFNEEWVKATGLARVLAEEGLQGLIDQTITYDQATVDTLTTLANRWDGFRESVERIIGRIIASFEPIFTAINRVFEQQIFPYLQNQALPRFQRLADQFVIPFAVTLFSSTTREELESRRSELERDLGDVFANLDIDGIDDLGLEFNIADLTAEGIRDQIAQIDAQLLAVDIASSFADVFMALDALVSPIVDGFLDSIDFVRNLFDIDIDEAAVAGFVLAIFGALRAAFGRNIGALGIAALFANLFRNVSERDTEGIAGAIVALIGGAVTLIASSNRIRRLGFTGVIVGGLVSAFSSESVANEIGAAAFAFSQLFTSRIVSALAPAGKAIAQALIDVIPPFIGRNLPQRILNAITTGVIRLVTGGLGVAFGGIAGAIAEAFRGGDAGDIIWQAILGSIVAGATLAFGPAGLVAGLIGTLLLDAIVGDDVSEAINNFFNDIAIRFLTGIVNIANNFIDFFNTVIDNINALNPFSDIGRIDPIRVDALLNDDQLRQFYGLPSADTPTFGTGDSNFVPTADTRTPFFSPDGTATVPLPQTANINLTLELDGQQLQRVTFENIALFDATGGRI